MMGMEQSEPRVGGLAWTRRLRWAWVQGPQVRDRYGVKEAMVGRPEPLAVRRLPEAGQCAECGEELPRRAMVGVSAGGAAYCGACLTTTRPEPEVRIESEEGVRVLVGAGAPMPRDPGCIRGRIGRVA